MFDVNKTQNTCFLEISFFDGNQCQNSLPAVAVSAGAPGHQVAQREGGATTVVGEGDALDTFMNDMVEHIEADKVGPVMGHSPAVHHLLSVSTDERDILEAPYG